MAAQDTRYCSWAHRPQMVCQRIAAVSRPSTVLAAAEAAWEVIKDYERTHCSVVHLTTVKCGATHRWTKPNNHLILNVAADLSRSKSELVLENAFLRQQLIILQRHGKRPALTQRDRVLFVLLSSKLRSWKQALMIVQPDTLLRWHRDLFCWVWKRRSRPKQKGGRAPLADDIVALIKQMAVENQSWGAERIRGELLKLGLRIAKSTIQAYIRGMREPRSPHQNWLTFLRNHAGETWACDFLQAYAGFDGEGQCIPRAPLHYREDMIRKCFQGEQDEYVSRTE